MTLLGEKINNFCLSPAFYSFSPLCNLSVTSVWAPMFSCGLNTLHATFIFPKKVWGDVEPGD